MNSILRSTSIVALSAALATASPGCLWKHKGKKNGSQTQPVSSAGSSVNVSGEGDDSFDKGINRPPTPKTLYSLAQILESQGKDNQAEPILRRIIVDEPRFMPAYCDLAELQMRQRRIEDAYRTLSAGLKISRDEPILLNNRGMCQVLLKDYEGALANFTRASSLRPDDARYRSNLAMTLGMLGRYDESYSLYTLVMPAQDARHNVALLAESAGDSDRAEEIRHGKHAAVPAKAPMPVAVSAPSAPAPSAPAVAAAPATAPVIVKVEKIEEQPTTAPAIAKAEEIEKIEKIEEQATTAPAIAKAEKIVEQPTSAPAMAKVDAQPATQPAIAQVIVAVEQPTTAPAIAEVEEVAKEPTTAPAIENIAEQPATQPAVIAADVIADETAEGQEQSAAAVTPPGAAQSPSEENEDPS
jgi:hypothetical protein